jgi:hypothetical protein
MDIAKGEHLNRIAELCGTKRKYLGLESDRALRKRLIGIIRGTGLGRESIIKRLVNKLRRKGEH